MENHHETDGPADPADIGPIQFGPVRVRFGQDPRPHLVLGFKGEELDVTRAVMGFELHVSVEDGELNNALILHLRPGVEQIDWETGEALIARPDAPPLAEVTADELDQILADKGWSETPGEAILAHLQQRGVAASD